MVDVLRILRQLMAESLWERLLEGSLLREVMVAILSSSPWRIATRSGSWQAASWSVSWRQPLKQLMTAASGAGMAN